MKESLTDIKVSIALCTHNGEKYLLEQLDSIAAQTHAADEIILCDDNSNDDTVAIAQQYRHQGLPLKIYQNEKQLGFVRNFSQAIQQCTGDIIFLCDQDDRWHSDKVSITLSHFSQHPNVLLIFSNGDLVNKETQPLNSRLWQALPTPPNQSPNFQELLNNDWITGAASAFRRELIEKALPIPSHWVHDAWLGLIAATFGQVRAIPDVLIQYRQHENNQIGLKPTTLKQKFSKALYLISTPHYEIPEKYYPLLDRLPNSHVQYQYVLGKIRHLENRQHRNRLRGIFKETMNKGYSQYANGWKSIIRDIMLLSYQTLHRIQPPSELK